jgi:hypothetical protein
VQFPVFFVLGGVGAIVGGVVAGTEHLDGLAIAEWGVVGLFGPPAVVCVGIFLVVRLRTPTKQRDDARNDLADAHRRIAELKTHADSVEAERDVARDEAVAAEGRTETTFVGGTHYHFPEDPDPALTERLTAAIEPAPPLAPPDPPAILPTWAPADQGPRPAADEGDAGDDGDEASSGHA